MNTVYDMSVYMLLCFISLFLNRSLYESESEHHILFLPYDQMSNDQMSYDQMSNVQMSNDQMPNVQMSNDQMSNVQMSNVQMPNDQM